MLRDTPVNVVGHADVGNSMRAVGHEVDVKLLHTELHLRTDEIPRLRSE
jgi:hypothetical protein